MSEPPRAQALQTVLVAVGIIFIAGLMPLMRFWPSGWAWTPAQPEYEQMFQAVYACLGVFLLWAARRPREHRSLILFAGWSSVVHGAVMGLQALRDTAERGHLVGDVPALMIVGVVLLLLAPKAAPASPA